MKEIITVAPSTKDYIRKGEGDIIELRDGRILMVYMEFSGTGSDYAKTRIVAQESSDRGRSWAKHRVIATTPPECLNLYSPNLIRDCKGAIILIFMSKDGEAHDHRYTFELWRSTDEGDQFHLVRKFMEGSSFCLCNAVIKRSSTGRLLLPVAKSRPEGFSGDQQATLLYSDDDGASWNESRNLVALPMRGAMEPHAEETAEGRLLMVVRNQLGSLFMAYSDDNGESWSKPQTTGLSSPEACPELTRIPGTDLLVMIWNHSPYDPCFASHFGRRNPLTSAISRDNGATWEQFRNIEDDPRRAFTNPGCRFLSDGTAIVNYWTCVYLETDFMQEQIDLRVALLERHWFLSEDQPLHS